MDHIVGMKPSSFQTVTDYNKNEDKIQAILSCAMQKRMAVLELYFFVGGPFNINPDKS